MVLILTGWCCPLNSNLSHFFVFVLELMVCSDVFLVFVWVFVGGLGGICGSSQVFLGDVLIWSL